MAYKFTASSSQALSIASAPATDYPITMSAWIKVNTPVLAGCVSLFRVDNNGDTRMLRLLSVSNGTNCNFRAQVINTASGTNSAFVETMSRANNSDWVCITAVFSSSSLRSIYYNGTKEGEDTVTVALGAALQGMRIGSSVTAFDFPFSNNLFSNADIADVGIWNVALTAEEIASLAKGVSCARIRPQSLKFHAPLMRDLIDTRGGLAITNNNAATVADHPRIFA